MCDPMLLKGVLETPISFYETEFKKCKNEMDYFRLLDDLNTIMTELVPDCKRFQELQELEKRIRKKINMNSVCISLVKLTNRV